MTPIEIERKFLIKMPSMELLKRQGAKAGEKAQDRNAFHGGRAQGKAE